jgi:hypothetical protein
VTVGSPKCTVYKNDLHCGVNVTFTSSCGKNVTHRQASRDQGRKKLPLRQLRCRKLALPNDSEVTFTVGKARIRAVMLIGSSVCPGGHRSSRRLIWTPFAISPGVRRLLARHRAESAAVGATNYLRPPKAPGVNAAHRKEDCKALCCWMPCAILPQILDHAACGRSWQGARGGRHRLPLE